MPDIARVAELTTQAFAELTAPAAAKPTPSASKRNKQGA